LKGNALQAINAVNSTRRNWSLFGQFVDNIRTTLNSFFNWQDRHINIVASTTAHGLANAVVKQAREQVWMEEIHNCVYETVLPA